LFAATAMTRRKIEPRQWLGGDELDGPGSVGGRLRSDFGRVSRKGPCFKGVMAGLVPAIHVFGAAYPIRQQQGAKGFVPVRSVADMRDRSSGERRVGRDKPGHDGRVQTRGQKAATGCIQKPPPQTTPASY
jgi:hypothetical protein